MPIGATKVSLILRNWISGKDIFVADFARLLDSEAGRRAFDDAFIDRVRIRRDELEKLSLKTSFLNSALLVALFLNAFLLPPELSVAGLSAHDVGKVKEIILFVSATVALFSVVLSIEAQYLGDVSLTWLKHKHGAEVTRFLAPLYSGWLGSWNWLGLGTNPKRVATRATSWFVLVTLIFLILFFVLYLSASLVVYVTVIINVIRKPSLPPLFAWPIIFYAGIAICAQLLLAVHRWVPLPFHDFSLVMEMMDLQKRAPDLYKERSIELAKKLKQ